MAFPIIDLLSNENRELIHYFLDPNHEEEEE